MEREREKLIGRKNAGHEKERKKNLTVMEREYLFLKMYFKNIYV